MHQPRAWSTMMDSLPGPRKAAEEGVWWTRRLLLSRLGCCS